jgi:hypothetical protein
MRKTRNAYRMWEEKSLGKYRLERPRRRWENKVKMYLKAGTDQGEQCT